jgi:hypothetical protein
MDPGFAMNRGLTGCRKNHFPQAAQKCLDARPPCLRRSGFAQAGEMLKSEAYLEVRCNKPSPCLTRGRMREVQQMGVFQQPAKVQRFQKIRRSIYRGNKMFRQASSDKLTKKIKVFLVQKKMDQKLLSRSTGLAPGETAEDILVKSVIDPRLTADENAILINRLLEVREAFIAMILSNRETSHYKDFVAG